MPPKSTPKGKTTKLNWMLCEKCKSYVPPKDVENHALSCPLDLQTINHPFIYQERLIGILNAKSEDPIKGLSEEQRNSMVFLSQSAMQLCNVSIGDLVALETVEATEVKDNKAIAGIAWPTYENSMASVLIAKDCIQLNEFKENSFVKVSKIIDNKVARKITLTIENGVKNMEITNELNVRINKHFVGQCTKIGNFFTILYYGKLLKLNVKEIIADENAPHEELLHEQFKALKLTNQFYKVVETTQFSVFRNFEEYQEVKLKKQYQLEQLGGLQREIAELLEMIETALLTENVLKIKPIKGVLLYGQSGTGKTHLIKALKNYKNVLTVLEINALDLYRKTSGNLEENIKKLFENSKTNQPSLVLMDEIDILCPQRSSRLTEAEKRIVSCILSELDFILNSDYKVFVVGVTNKLDAVDPSLRRCGRFDREIEIPVPNPIARLEILKSITKDSVDLEILQKVSSETHGFVGSDLITLCATAQQKNLKTLTLEEFQYALTKIRPSAMREVQIEVPNVKWSDIGGQHRLKLILKQCVEWPLKHPESFRKLGITPPKGVLMYGPPGCSKTMIAKALATESGLNFLSIKGPELFSKWVGESEKAIREVFRKARLVAPSVIFFDEIDALGGERSSNGSSSSVQERVLAQLLTELDGISDLGHVTVVAATNRPDRIDGALLRPGRLDRLVYVSLPDEETRLEIFKIKIAKMSCKDVAVDVLVNNTEGYSGAEVNAVCHEAAMLALEESLDAEYVEMRHFLKSMKLVTPRTSLSMVKMYEEYEDNKF